jgi:hypothetical protein
VNPGVLVRPTTGTMMRDSPAGTPPHPSRRSLPRVARLAVVLGGPPEGLMRAAWRLPTG